MIEHGSFYQFMKWTFSLIPIFIAGLVSENSLVWIAAYGVFIVTFGLIVISEQLENLIHLEVKENGKGNL